MVVLVLLLLLLLLRPLQREDVVLERDLDVLPPDPRQLGRQPVGAVLLRQLDGGTSLHGLGAHGAPGEAPECAEPVVELIALRTLQERQARWCW